MIRIVFLVDFDGYKAGKSYSVERVLGARYIERGVAEPMTVYVERQRKQAEDKKAEELRKEAEKKEAEEARKEELISKRKTRGKATGDSAKVEESEQAVIK